MKWLVQYNTRKKGKGTTQSRNTNASKYTKLPIKMKHDQNFLRKILACKLERGEKIQDYGHIVKSVLKKYFNYNKTV